MKIKNSKLKLGLFIPDAHSEPEHDNKRFEALGKLMYDIRPDFVVEIGDFTDFASLCKYDTNKKVEFNNRRYAKDCEHSLDAQDKLWWQYRKNKKAFPLRVKHIGNHENRGNKAVEANPVLLEGKLNITKDLDLHYNWDIVVPYDGDHPGYMFLNDILFAHYVTNGNTSNATAGINPATILLNTTYMSTVVAHSHIYDICIKTRADGKKMVGLVGGWFGDYKPSYVGAGYNRWTSGITLMKNVDNGYYEPDFIATETIKKEYR